MKFKIGDKVKMVGQENIQGMKTFKGCIYECRENKPENLKIEDGEYVYEVFHYNYRGRMTFHYSIKESNLILLEE
jgi:hypothetical protein